MRSRSESSLIDAAHDDEREQHPEQQVEEVVRRVDRGEPDAERDADEELSLARELQPSGGPDPALPSREVTRERLGREGRGHRAGGPA